MSLTYMTLEMLFYNVNIESASFFNVIFENQGKTVSSATTHKQSVFQAQFLVKLADFDSIYFNEQVVLWTIKGLFTIFLLYLTWQWITKVILL